MKMKTSCDYVNKLNELFINSAESILKVGNIFCEAKSNLTKDDYQKFLTATKYAENSASVRKWLKIGEAYIRLKPLAVRLPPNWSTIYKLAKLRASELDALISANVLSRDVTAKEIDAELKPVTKKKVIQIILEFDSAIDAMSFQKDLNEISKLLPANLCEVSLSKDADLLMKQAIQIVKPLQKAA